MTKRRVHLRDFQGVIWQNQSKTRCHMTIGNVAHGQEGAIIHASNVDVTVHGTLVTCEKCLKMMRGLSLPAVKFDLDNLRSSRNIIAGLDTSMEHSWQAILLQMHNAGFTVADLMDMFAASTHTMLYWFANQTRPREMTRRLLKDACIEAINERMG